MNELDALCGAYGAAGPYYDECMRTCQWFSERMMARFLAKDYKTLVSLGVGYTAVNQSVVAKLGKKLEKYWIVDGSEQMLEKVRQEVTLADTMTTVHAWFEEFDPGQKVDAIEMGFILEHVEDPLALVKRYVNFLAPGGTLFIAVPNATSLHRQIGHEAGLLPDLYQLSDYDRGFGHRRYFDLAAIRSLVEAAGLTVKTTEGILLKPITTGQMKELAFSEEIIKAFFTMGIAYPELSNSLYLEAQL